MTSSGEEVATLTAQAITGADFFSTPSLGDDFDFLNGYGGSNGATTNGQTYQYGQQMIQYGGQSGHMIGSSQDHQQQQHFQTNQPHPNYYAQPQPNQYQTQTTTQDQQRQPHPSQMSQQQYFSPPVSSGSPLSNSSDQFDSGFDSPPMMSNHQQQQQQYHGGYNGQHQQQPPMQYYQTGAGYGQPQQQHHYAPMTAPATAGGAGQHQQATSTTTNVLNSPLSSNNSSSSTCDPFESNSGSDSPHSNHYGHHYQQGGHPHHGQHPHQQQQQQQFHYVNGVGGAGGGAVYSSHGLPPMAVSTNGVPMPVQVADTRKPGGGKKTTATTGVASSTSTVAKRDKKPGKKRRDPNEPQKPVSAYALFFRDTQATIKGGNPNASFGEVSKIVASMWDSLDPNAKFNYKKKTEQAKKEYLKALAAYRASLLNSNSVSSAGHPQHHPQQLQQQQQHMPSSPTALVRPSPGSTMHQQPSPLQKRSPLLTSALQIKRDDGSPVAVPSPTPTSMTPYQMSSPGQQHPLSVQVPQQQQQQPNQHHQQQLLSSTTSPFGPGRPMMNQHQPSTWPSGQVVWTSTGTGD